LINLIYLSGSLNNPSYALISSSGDSNSNVDVDDSDDEEETRIVSVVMVLNSGEFDGLLGMREDSVMTSMNSLSVILVVGEQ
jgi:hypothetical protein